MGGLYVLYYILDLWTPTQPYSYLCHPFQIILAPRHEHILRILCINVFQPRQQFDDILVARIEFHGGLPIFFELKAHCLSQSCNPAVLDDFYVVDFLTHNVGSFLKTKILQKTQDDHMALVVGELCVHG